MAEPAKRLLPIEEQVEAAERELAYRERVYPRRIAKGQMTKKLADYQLLAMRAILETLRGIAAGERLL